MYFLSALNKLIYVTSNLICLSNKISLQVSITILLERKIWSKHFFRCKFFNLFGWSCLSIWIRMYLTDKVNQLINGLQAHLVVSKTLVIIMTSCWTTIMIQFSTTSNMHPLSNKQPPSFKCVFVKNRVCTLSPIKNYSLRTFQGLSRAHFPFFKDVRWSVIIVFICFLLFCVTNILPVTFIFKLGTCETGWDEVSRKIHGL